MKVFCIALATGLLVGGIYGLLNVKAPAPPYAALFGLLGIGLGEQAMVFLTSRVADPVEQSAVAATETTPRVDRGVITVQLASMSKASDEKAGAVN